MYEHMKVGIIGFGSIGQRHFENLKRRKDVEIVIFSKRTDVNDSKVVSTWEELGNKRGFDAFFITNETSKHVETIERCLQLYPKALLIEKPLSHTSRGLENIAKSIEESSVSVWVGYNFHFFRPFIRIKEIIKSNVLGRIYYLRVAVGQDLSEWRQRDYTKCYSSSKDGGGGVLLDLVHDINYPAWLLDEELIPQACVMKQISTLDIAVEDWAESVLSTDSGIMVSVHQDYVRVPYKRSLEIVGDRASLSWDTDANNMAVLDRKKNLTLFEHIEEDRNRMFEKEIDFFIDSLRAGKNFSNIKEAIRDVAIIETLKSYAAK